jgi:hypothetical protein
VSTRRIGVIAFRRARLSNPGARMEHVRFVESVFSHGILAEIESPGDAPVIAQGGSRRVSCEL